MSLDLSGSVALVSGAAGCLGRATCEALAEVGATVIATDLPGQFSPEGGVEAALTLDLDVTDEVNWQSVVAEVERRYERLDILVNAAGIAPITRLETLSLETWKRCQSINVDGTFLGMKSATPLLKRSGALRRGGAAVVNFSSIAGLTGGPNAAAYCTSKGAVRLLTKAAAVEFSSLGYKIRVNSIHPGSIDTDMVDTIARDVAELRKDVTPEEVKAAFIAAHPIGRLGKPSEIAAGVRFLASDDASFIHGSELVVDGGFTCK